jgi:hypothetical protein
MTRRGMRSSLSIPGVGVAELGTAKGPREFMYNGEIFFNLSDGTLTEDERGGQLSTLDDAKEHARLVASEMGRNRDDDDIAGWSIKVMDETGSEVYSAPLTNKEYP